MMNGLRVGQKNAHQNQPCTDAKYPSPLDAPPFHYSSSATHLHRLPVQTNVSPAMSPRVGPCAQTQAIRTVLGQKMHGEGWESEMRYIRRSSRILWRYVGESGHRVPYRHGHGHASEHSTSTCQFYLGRCEKVVEGVFTIYGKYMLIFECLHYLLLAGLKFYLSIFNSKLFPLHLEK